MIVNLVKRSGNSYSVKQFFNHFVRCYSVQKSNVTGASYWHNVGSAPLFYKTLGRCVDEAALQYGDREALVSLHEGLRYSFKDIRDQSDKLAAGFHSAGLKPGDRLGIWSPNCAHWYLTMMAAAKAGLVLVGINPAYRASEMEYCLNKVDVRGLVSASKYKASNFYGILLEIAPELKHCEPGRLQSIRLPNLKTLVIADDEKLPGAHKFNDIPALATVESHKEIEIIKNSIQPDDPLNIQFTSGTTGKPKAACINHFTLLNNGFHVGQRNELPGTHHKICVQVPLFHAFGVVITISAALQNGATLVLPGPGFNPAESLEAIAKEKCTVIHGTPTMYVDLIAKQREIKANLDSVQIAVTGGAPCSPNLFRQMLEELKVKKVKTVFGLTETTAVIFQTRPGDDIGKITDSVGFVQDHVEVKVVDDKGQVVPFGTPGELLIRGYPNMLGYWGDEHKTEDMIGADGWLKTGDQFVLQEDGYGRIVGRLKEMIIRGGENLFPKEIEDFINTHPDVLETYVIGVPSERLGEEVCAFVRVRDGKKLDQKSLKEYCNGKIAHFKIPQYVIQVNTFPKTTSGKIQKYKLQRLYAGGEEEFTSSEAPLLTI